MDTLFQIILATQIYSLARFSKRTIELQRALSFHSYQVSGSFNSLLKVLFNISFTVLVRYRTQSVFNVRS